MPAPIIDICEQRSETWEKLHIGIPTAANFHKILTPGGKATDSKTRRDYIYRLVAERLLNEYLPERAVTTARTYWMDRGIVMEPIAVAALKREQGLEFQPVGFIKSADRTMGCSPDGIIYGGGNRPNQGVEIKAPAPWTQVEYLLAGPGTDYKPQVQGQMLIGQFECVHFFAFHPRMPSVYLCSLRDDAYLKTLRQAVDDFVGEVDEATKKAKAMGTFIPLEEILAGTGPATVGG